MKRSIFMLLIMCTLAAQAPRVSGGGGFSVAVNTQGKAFAWGLNNYGHLGNTTTTNSDVPVAVYDGGLLAGKTITAVAAGLMHCLALASDGTVYSWGYNGSHGYLGNNSTYNSTSPVAVNTIPGKTMTAVAAGYDHSLEVADDGTVYAWGKNTNGQLGGSASSSSKIPVAVNMESVLSGKTITAVAAGKSHSLALDSDGKVYAWGLNDKGQLGDSTNTARLVPVAVREAGGASGSNLSGITAIAAGDNHSLALASDGTVYAWGWNGYGQLGNDTQVNSNYPVAVNTVPGKTMTAIAGGAYHSLAIASDSTVYAWGWNNYSQLGNNVMYISKIPVNVSNLSGITAIAGGQYHSLAVASDHNVYAWGANDYGQLGNNSTTGSYVPVTVVNADDSEFSLPVELASFTASLEEGAVELKWITESEIDNLGFFIERSDDGSGWQEIASYKTDPALKGQGSVTHRTVYRFRDKNITGGVKYDYRLADVSYFGQVEYHGLKSGIESSAKSIQPGQFSVGKNYPNPFNPTTTLTWQQAAESAVRVNVYDLNGHLVKELVNDGREAGSHNVTWDATDAYGRSVSAGMYFYTIKSGDFMQTRKMVLLK